MEVAGIPVLGDFPLVGVKEVGETGDVVAMGMGGHYHVDGVDLGHDTVRDRCKALKEVAPWSVSRRLRPSLGGV
jgi:hypothetical protein